MNDLSAIFDQVIQESVLMESAVDAMRDRFHQDHGLHPEVFNHLYHNALPDHNKSLGDMEWMANREVKGENVAENHETVKHVMTEFAKPDIKAKLQKKKANQYKTFQDLHDAVAPHIGSAPTKKESEEEGTETIYKSDSHIIKKHNTQESMVQAAKLQRDNPHYKNCSGKATWCVSAEGDQGKSYFNSYTKGGQHPFYSIEHTAKHPTDPNRKFAVLHDPNRDETTHEVRDEPQIGRMDLGTYVMKNQSILHTQPGQYISKLIGLSHTPEGISYKENRKDVKIEKKEGGGYIKTRSGYSDKSIEHLNDNFDLHGRYELNDNSYRTTGNYKDGKKHGKFTFSEKRTGITLTREQWNEGKLLDSKEFDPSFGNIESHEKFDGNGNPSETIRYHKNGNIKEHNFYDTESKGVEESKRFHENGKLKLSVSNKIKNGDYYKNKVLYGENGTKLSEENFKNGKRHGKHVDYHYNGNIQSEYNYLNGDLHGMYKIYYENGNLNTATPFKNGKVDGVAREKREDGSLKSETEYSKGREHGMKRTYHENGNIDEEISYEKGYVHGPVRSYHENGNLMSEYNAVKGDIVGKVKTFRQDGYLRYIKNYIPRKDTVGYREFGDRENVKDYDFENSKPIYESYTRFRKIVEGR